MWVAESFVDTQLFRGTSCKTSGWTPLVPPKNRRRLCAEHLPEKVALVVESKVPPKCEFRVGPLRSLREHFAGVADFRGRVESYPLSSVLAMVACAHLSGAPLGHRDLRAFARRLSQAQRRALGVRRDRSGCYPAPSKATFGRVLSAVDPLQVEAALLAWQQQVRGPAPRSQLLAADGKELRRAQGAQVVTLTHPESPCYRGSHGSTQGLLSLCRSMRGALASGLGRPARPPIPADPS